MSSPSVGWIRCLFCFAAIYFDKNRIEFSHFNLNLFLSEALASFKFVRIEEMTLYAIIFTIIL